MRQHLGSAVIAVAAALGIGVAPVARAQDQDPPPPRDAEVVGIVTVDGQPSSGTTVEVVATDTGIARGAFALFSFGLACLLPEMCLAGHDAVATTTTDDAGGYRATLPDAYVAGTETDTDWLVTASLPAGDAQLGGASSTFELEVNTALQEAPPLPLWPATPTVTANAWRIALAASPPPPGLSGPQVVFTSVGGSAVRVDGLDADIDVRFLEPESHSGGDAGDQPIVAAATAYADVTVRHAEGRTIYHQRVSTPAPKLPIGLSQLVPVSRGADCDLDPCPLTDGSFGVPAPDDDEVTVTLPTPLELADVFVRGCDASCVVDASGDGSSWAPLTNDIAASRLAPAIGEPSVLVASLRPPLPARMVRVRRDALAATEVSLWPPAPPAPLAPAAGGDGARPSTATTDGDADDAESGPPLALVVAATALLAGAGGIAIGRLRRR